MTKFRPSPRLLASVAAFLFLSGITVACGSDPFTITWVATPDTAVLYSLARPELGLPSAFGFYGRARIVVEAPGTSSAWDMALDTRDGRLALVPPGALNIVNEARITVIEGASFDDVTEAPADTTLYTATGPAFLELGNVYVVKTRKQSTTFGFCSLYAKLEPLVVDPEVGSFTFVFDFNPRCEDRKLVADQEREP